VKGAALTHINNAAGRHALRQSVASTTCPAATANACAAGNTLLT
jgi:hypothetical protein